MKRIFLLLFVWFASLALSAQGFTIQDFEVVLDVQPDGVIKVTENILVDFEVSKHGLYRDIPVDYVSREENDAKALNRLGLDEYHLLIDEVEVEGKEFSTLRENGNLSIKIGSAELYEKGPTRYKIHYTVYDVVNYFIGFDEIYWNLTGNDWPTPVGNVRFTVNLPKAIPFGKDDIRIFTGAIGSKEQAATFSVQGKTITGQTTRQMGKGEGVTLGVRFPNGYLQHKPIPPMVRARDFYIESLVGKYEVARDGIIQVTLTYTTIAKRPNQPFEARLSDVFSGTLLEGSPDHLKLEYWGDHSMMAEVVSVTEYSTPGTHSFSLTQTPSRSNYGVTTSIVSEMSQKGAKQVFEVKFRLYGAVKIEGSDAYIQLELLDGLHSEPIGQTQFTLELPEGVSPSTVKAKERYHSLGAVPTQIEGNKVTVGPYSPAFSITRVDLGMKFPAEGFKESQIPARLWADDYYWDHYQQDWLIRKNGSVEVHALATVVPFSGYVYPRLNIETGFSDQHYAWSHERVYQLPRYSVFGRNWKISLSHQKAIQNVAFVPAYRYFTEVICHENLPANEPSTMEWAYELFGIVHSTDTGNVIHYPILSRWNEPIQDCELRIRLEDSLQMANTTAIFQIFNEDSLIWKGPGRLEGNTLVWNPPHSLRGGHSVDLMLIAPKGAISNSFWSSFSLWAQNNPLLLLPPILLILLVVLWFVVGRDRMPSVMVEYYPPKDLDTAEAGLLNDAKLQNSDLLSLIYHWASKGLVTIEEVEMSGGRGLTDYQLTKIKNLPSNARAYERTLFSNLFSNRTTVKVSSLRYSFSHVVAKARRELESHGKKLQFFSPGSRGLGSFLRFLGWVLLILAVISAGMILFNPLKLNTAWGWLISYGLSGLMLVFFGRIMPRFGKRGKELWGKLAGFKEFVATAEQDRLKSLVNENPDYFEETLAYAIAFGLANEWAKKFDGLTLTNPNWYKSSGTTYTSSSQFTRALMQNLTVMNRQFTAVRPSTSSSGGYSSSGRSYSSFSSRSSSSGSSFSSGSSGGGFGGGGGRSW